MTLIKWNSVLRPSLFNDMDGWFNNVSSDLPAFFHNTSEWSPNFEVLNSADAYRVRADLPGLTKKDVEIEINEDIITIKGERANEYMDDSNYSELTYGKFSRSFNLPDDVKQKDIKASMKDGVLAVEIPRAKQVETKAKKILIK